MFLSALKGRRGLDPPQLPEDEGRDRIRLKHHARLDGMRISQKQGSLPWMRAAQSFLAIAVCLAGLAGCALTGGDLVDIGAGLNESGNAIDEHARKEYLRDLELANDERSRKGLLPLDLCSESYWKHRRWAMRMKDCGARVRRWEFGDYTALDPSGMPLPATVSVVSDSVQRIYDERAREDRFLHSDDVEDSRDYHARLRFRQDLQRSSAERLKQGLLPLDLCSQSFWRKKQWALKVEGCAARIHRWECGDSTALDPRGAALPTTVPIVPDSVQRIYDERAREGHRSAKHRDGS